ncbi:MAG: hypothetical protein MUE53_03560 [Chitinophagales bacterium]|jgi:phosphomannomutase|nr:hypothetical protein [Chitinophagales bacterium]
MSDKIYKIKFGTDGWRDIIGDTYTVANVARTATATAKWILEHYPQKAIVLGYDCRFQGLLFAQTVIRVMYHSGIKVYFDDQFITTPCLSLAASKFPVALGVIITASHNPPSYSGYKLKSNQGGPTPESEIKSIEAIIPDIFEADLTVSMDEIKAKGMLEIVNFREIYLDEVAAKFDLKALQSSSLKISYNAMFGGGQAIIPHILPQADLFNCEWNPNFNHFSPEPIAKNMSDYLAHVAHHKFDFSLVNDGDADRIALVDSHGKYINAHLIILMLIYILKVHKKFEGKVVIAFSVSPKINKLCQQLGIEVITTPIGFKYIAPYVLADHVICGGEESGGISVIGHIPERDGIWDGLVILDYLNQTHMSLNDLIDKIFELVGPFEYSRRDLTLTMAQKDSIVAYVQGDLSDLAGHKILETQRIDGVKFILEHERNVMIRASGTEPVLRVYCQAETSQKVEEILEEVVNFLKTIS